MENELLQNTPEEIARFLYKGEGLNKTAIGDYLGRGENRAPCTQLLPRRGPDRSALQLDCDKMD